MQVEFTASDGGTCCVLINPRNLKKLKKKWPDLRVKLPNEKGILMAIEEGMI